MTGMNRQWRHWVAALVAVACMGLTTGCTSSEPGSSNNEPVVPSGSVPSGVSPVAKSLIDQAYADPAVTDFERTVLSDYVVTDQEASEGKDRYVQCMSDHGWVASIDSNWQTTVYAAPGSGKEGSTSSDDNNLCMTGTLAWIEPIYLEERNNPEGLTYGQQVRACFTKNGLPDGDGLSDDQIEQMALDPNDDLHPSTAEAYRCCLDPSESMGVSLSQAEQMFQSAYPQWAGAQPSGQPS